MKPGVVRDASPKVRGRKTPRGGLAGGLAGLGGDGEAAWVGWRGEEKMELERKLFMSSSAVGAVCSASAWWSVAARGDATGGGRSGVATGGATGAATGTFWLSLAGWFCREAAAPAGGRSEGVSISTGLKEEVAEGSISSPRSCRAGAACPSGPAYS